MKRTLLIVVILLLLVLCCAPNEERVNVDAITGATRKLLEMADARGCYQEFPEEDGRVSSEGWMIENAGGSFQTMEAGSKTAYIEAYTDKKSYFPGETIYFHVSTNAATYSLEICKEEWTKKVMSKVTGLVGAYYPVPPPSEEPWAEGAKWPVVYSMVVPPEWENGNYLALFRTTSGDYVFTYHPFIVRTYVPGSRSKVVFVLNYNTRNAYNQWGGKSLYYSGIAGDSHYAVAVSFLRPFHFSYGRGNSYWESSYLSHFLVGEGFNPEYLTEYDIDSDPAVLQAYDVVVFSGHHEYISRNVYDAIESHHRRGGHLAFFSANDIYWQVRFEDNGNKMVSYKGYSSREDPMRNVDQSLVTTLWRNPPVNRPPEALQGICYTPYSYCFYDGDYTVRDANHFAFVGTGLKNGDVVGSRVAAGETDYFSPASPAIVDVLMDSRRALVRPGYEDYIRVDYVDAAAVYYEDSPEYGFADGRGGQVFSAGTHWGWGAALEASHVDYQVMRQITLNIIQHMVDTARPPVGFKDLAMVTEHWLGQCSAPDWCQDSDIDMSGTVSMKDFAYLVRNWSN